MQKELIELSHSIWKAYQNHDIQKMKEAVYEDCRFVHMGVTLDLEGEIEAVEKDLIVYKDIDIEESSVRIFGNTAVVLNKLKLTAIVEGHEVVNPFIVTEVFVKDEVWKLASLAYTRITY